MTATVYLVHGTLDTYGDDSRPTESEVVAVTACADTAEACAELEAARYAHLAACSARRTSRRRWEVRDAGAFRYSVTIERRPDPDAPCVEEGT